MSNIDYCRTNFEIPVLTKNSGQPNYALLKIIKDELKSNAASVSSNLGGGGNGHAVLVLTGLEYAALNDMPYIRPVHPGILVIPEGSSAVPQYMRSEIREDHKVVIHIFREVDDVDKAVKNQLPEALPDLYLKQFRDRQTNILQDTLQVILQHLFSTYGDLTPEELSSTKEKLKA